MAIPEVVKQQEEKGRRDNERFILPTALRYYREPLQEVLRFGILDHDGIDARRFKNQRGKELDMAFRALDMFDANECPCPTIMQEVPPRPHGRNEVDKLCAGGIGDYWYSRKWRDGGACIFMLDAKRMGMAVRDKLVEGVDYFWKPNRKTNNGFYCIPNYAQVVYAVHHRRCPAVTGVKLPAGQRR